LSVMKSPANAEQMLTKTATTHLWDGSRFLRPDLTLSI
jgi:hypothetical protein